MISREEYFIQVLPCDPFGCFKWPFRGLLMTFIDQKVTTGTSWIIFSEQISCHLLVNFLNIIYLGKSWTISWIRSRERYATITYPTMEKGKSSTQKCRRQDGICDRFQEGSSWFQLPHANRNHKSFLSLRTRTVFRSVWYLRSPRGRALFLLVKGIGV